MRLLRFQLGMKLYREDIRFVLFVEEDKTQDFIDSINNKTYPQLPNEYFTIDDMKEQGWTEEAGWPHYNSDYAIYKEMGVNPEDMKDVPPFGMLILPLGGWDGQL